MLKLFELSRVIKQLCLTVLCKMDLGNSILGQPQPSGVIALTVAHRVMDHVKLYIATVCKGAASAVFEVFFTVQL